ncbi:MAG: LysR substrate-binding domain-containing protein, partial [Pseudomonadota bacterium]
LGRQVSALEAELGVILFDRVGKRLVLTPEGGMLLAQCRAMGDAAARLSLTASGASKRIEGKIRITVSELYAAETLPRVLATLRAAHPGIEIDILATNDMADLRRREADIAIRNAAPKEPDLIARRLPDDEAGLFATRDYLSRLPRTDRPEDFAEATFLGFSGNAELIAGYTARGIPVTEANFTINTGESHLVHWAHTKAGLGIGIGPVSCGEADPTLVRVLPDLEPFIFPVWLVAAQELRTSARVRTVFDLLAVELSRGRSRLAAGV